MSKEVDTVKLQAEMLARFNKSELADICHTLKIEYEDLAGDTRTDKVRELITYMERRGWLVRLVNVCKELRPTANWNFNDTP